MERERALVRLQKELQEEERKERAKQWERFMAYRNQLVRRPSGRPPPLSRDPDPLGATQGLRPWESRNATTVVDRVLDLCAPLICTQPYGNTFCVFP